MSKKTKENRYNYLLNSEITEEYKELKEEYKDNKKMCTTQAQRTILMKGYMDDLVDLAIEARLVGEFELNSELNTLIQSLQRRTYTGRRNW